MHALSRSGWVGSIPQGAAFPPIFRQKFFKSHLYMPSPLGRQIRRKQAMQRVLEYLEAKLVKELHAPTPRLYHISIALGIVEQALTRKASPSLPASIEVQLYVSFISRIACCRCGKWQWRSDRTISLVTMLRYHYWQWYCVKCVKFC